MTRERFWGVAALVVAIGIGAMLGRKPVLAAPGSSDVPRPPDRLADTGLYLDVRSELIDPANRPFAPQYPLWSDGLTKKRWVYLPPGGVIDATDDSGWRFPVGYPVLEGVQSERTQRRNAPVMASRERLGVRELPLERRWHRRGAGVRRGCGRRRRGGKRPASQHPVTNRLHRLHGTTRAGPLGFNPLQLSTDRDPNAIHGEPLAPGMITLKDLVEEHRLMPQRHELVSNPPRIQTNNPATRAVLGYLAANCAMCHDGSDGVAVLGPSLKYADLMENADLRRAQSRRTPLDLAGARPVRRLHQTRASRRPGAQRPAPAHAFPLTILPDATTRHRRPRSACCRRDHALDSGALTSTSAQVRRCARAQVRTCT